MRVAGFDYEFECSVNEVIARGLAVLILKNAT